MLRPALYDRDRCEGSRFPGYALRFAFSFGRSHNTRTKTIGVVVPVIKAEKGVQLFDRRSKIQEVHSFSDPIGEDPVLEYWYLM